MNALAEKRIPQRKWRLLYAAITVVSAVVVALGNETISAFLASGSASGALALLVLLPLAAVATRPVYIRVGERNEPRRVIGVIWALRMGRVGFFIKTFFVWIGIIVVAGIASIVLYRYEGVSFTAGLSNWLLVASALTLLAHAIPHDVRLPPAASVQVFVLGPKGAGKTTFIVLAPLDRRSPESATWIVAPSAVSAALAGQLFTKRRVDPAMLQSAAPRHVVTRRRIWSQFVGLRPQPVELIEVPPGASTNPFQAVRGKSGFVVVVPKGSEAKQIDEQIERIRGIAAGGGPAARIRYPVAIVISRCDGDLDRMRESIALDEESERIVQTAVRKWAIFRTTDRAGERDLNDPEGFTPAGQVTAIAWLLSSM